MSDPILIKKKDKDTISESSTIAIEQLKQAALKIALIKKHGVKLEINVINNLERQNVNIKITEEYD